MQPNEPLPTEETEAPDAWELFLLALRYRGSRLLALGGNAPFLLAGADNAWMVYQGTVDVFAVELHDGVPTGARHHLLRANRYDLLLGQDFAHREIGLLAVCGPDTEVLRFGTDRLTHQLKKPENVPIIARLLETWARALASGADSAMRPKDIKALYADETRALVAKDTVRAGRDIVWVQHLSGASLYLGRRDGVLGHAPDSTVAPDALFPLTDRVWLRAEGRVELRAFTTAEILQNEAGWAQFAAFHRLVLKLIARDVQRQKKTVGKMLHDQIASDEQRLQTAVTQLASTWSAQPVSAAVTDASAGALLAACQRVGKQLGIRMKSPPDYDGSDVYQESLDELARASQVRIRRVMLRGEWWRKDNGPLLAYTVGGAAEGGADDTLGHIRLTKVPVALLRGRREGYELHNPATSTVQPVTQEVAATLNADAYTFYRPFPDRALGAWDVLRFGLHGVRRDWLTLLLAGALGGLLALVVPVITGILFDRVIPAGEREQLWVFGAVLLTGAFATAVFLVARGIALLRIEGRMDSAIYAALWDRILSLPADFFRKYSAGDLTERAVGFITLKQVLSGLVVLTLLTGAFSWLNLLVMAAYDVQLALIAVLLALLLLALSATLGMQFLRAQRQVAHTRGEISGLVTQLMHGMSKLRVAGAEKRAFALWAGAFSEQKKHAFRAQTARNMQSVLVAMYPILAGIVVFAVAYERTLSTGAFLAFNAAFAQFLAAMLVFSATLLTVLSTVPLYERLRPILTLRPEVDEQKVHPGELTGAIEVNHVVFRYDKDGPLVLDDVTFTVKPGEFVALVGPSGSGKSTLLRHLLGFEMPDSGAVYFDGQSLSEVDLRAVRRQIGVVLQHSQVLTGTMLENITGASHLNEKDAWDAARRAGIADDIEQMPMGMQTYVSEGGTTLSGGQRQRLLIARALVTRPRIIFFDEATSALDDRSQALVTESLKQVDATRIVIAHRLSTIVDADRILVMQRGRLVESGTYQTLMARRGVFARLAERQLV